MSGKKKLDNMGVSAFCESMGMMARAGIQTDEAISLLSSSSQTEGVLGSALVQMNKMVEEGSTLADAMKDSGIFPEYAIQMVDAGENSGRLEDILFRLSEYYAEQKTIAEKLKSAITYPAAMLLMIIAVLIIMLTMVLPAFSDVYDNLTGSLASSTYSYIRWAYGFSWVALIIMVVLAVLLLAGSLLWKSGRKGTVEKAIRKIPICASILDSMGLFRFTSALETYLASGEMQDMAVANSLRMTDCVQVEEKIKKSMDQMQEGHSFAQASYNEELFEPVYGRMLLAGERSGDMESVLKRLTRLLSENCTAKVGKLVDTVDPLLSGILMVTVGLSLLSVMIPLIGMMNSIG